MFFFITLKHCRVLNARLIESTFQTNHYDQEGEENDLTESDIETDPKEWTESSESDSDEGEREDLWKFLALTVLMGVNKRPTIEDYWNTNELLCNHLYLSL